jgi:hypothetical protein
MEGVELFDNLVSKFSGSVDIGEGWGFGRIFAESEFPGSPYVIGFDIRLKEVPGFLFC